VGGAPCARGQQGGRGGGGWVATSAFWFGLEMSFWKAGFLFSLKQFTCLGRLKKLLCHGVTRHNLFPSFITTHLPG